MDRQLSDLDGTMLDDLLNGHIPVSSQDAQVDMGQSDASAYLFGDLSGIEGFTSVGVGGDGSSAENSAQLSISEDCEAPFSTNDFTINKDLNIMNDNTAISVKEEASVQDSKQPSSVKALEVHLPGKNLIDDISKLLEERFGHSRNNNENLAAELATTKEQLYDAETKIRYLNTQLEEKEVELVKVTAEKDFIHKSRVKDNEELRQLMMRIDEHCRKSSNEKSRKANEFNDIAASIRATLDGINTTANQLAAEQFKLQTQLNGMTGRSEVEGGSLAARKEDMADILTTEKFVELSEGLLTEAAFTNAFKNLVTTQEFATFRDDALTSEYLSEALDAMLTTEYFKECMKDVATTKDLEKLNENALNSTPSDDTSSGLTAISDFNERIEHPHVPHDPEGFQETTQSIASLNDTLQQLLAKDLVTTEALNDALKDFLTTSEFTESIKHLVTINDFAKFTESIPSTTYLNTILSTLLSIDDFNDGMDNIGNAIQALLKESTFNDVHSKLLKSDSFHKKVNAALKTFNEVSKTFLTSETFAEIAENLLTNEAFEEGLKNGVAPLLTTEVFVDIAKNFLTKDAFLAFMGGVYKLKKHSPAEQPKPENTTPRYEVPPQYNATSADTRNFVTPPSRMNSPAPPAPGSSGTSIADSASPHRPSIFSGIFKARQKRAAEAEDNEGMMGKRRRLQSEPR